MIELVVFGVFAVVLAVVPSLIERLDRRGRRGVVHELFVVDECDHVLVARRPAADV